MEQKELLAASRLIVVQDLLSSPGDQIPKDKEAERKVVRVSDTHDKADQSAASNGSILETEQYQVFRAWLGR